MPSLNGMTFALRWANGTVCANLNCKQSKLEFEYDHQAGRIDNAGWHRI